MDNAIFLIVIGVIAGVIVLAVEYGIFKRRLNSRPDISSVQRSIWRVLLFGYGAMRRLVLTVWESIKFYAYFLSIVVVGLFWVIAPLVIVVTVDYLAKNPGSTNNETTKNLISVTIYGIVLVWGLSLLALTGWVKAHQLNNQIDYLYRFPGIKEIEQRYNEQLYENVKSNWDEFLDTLRQNRASLANDLSICKPLKVENETLVVECPSNLVCDRINNVRQGSDENSHYYRQSIERHMRKCFTKPDRIRGELVASGATPQSVS